MKTVRVYCGESIQGSCREQRHPVKEVEAANELVNSSYDVIAYSNHPDFVSAIKWIGRKQNVATEFFLNGVSCGDDIEPIFKDFNRAIGIIHELGMT